MLDPYEEILSLSVLSSSPHLVRLSPVLPTPLTTF
jgi:hypothetical protein